MPPSAPATPGPSVLLDWPGRTHRALMGEYTLDVPLTGGVPPRGASERLSCLLDEQWVVGSATGTRRQLTSVLAVIWNTTRLSPARPSRYLLSLQMWAPHLHPGTRLDDDLMGVELAMALDAACAAES